VKHNTTLQRTVDLEVHAVGSMLHDLGLVLNGSWISHDRRFEVDAAIATTDFVEGQVAKDGEGFAWDANRLQLLFDSVLLSSEPKFSLYKQPTVATVVQGVLIDLEGAALYPSLGITASEYGNVEAAFPRLDFITAVNATLVQLCTTKANTTYGKSQPSPLAPGCIAPNTHMLMRHGDPWQIRGNRFGETPMCRAIQQWDTASSTSSGRPTWLGGWAAALYSGKQPARSRGFNQWLVPRIGRTVGVAVTVPFMTAREF
jgi:hypothetical protein